MIKVENTLFLAVATANTLLWVPPLSYAAVRGLRLLSQKPGEEVLTEEEIREYDLEFGGSFLKHTNDYPTQPFLAEEEGKTSGRPAAAVSIEKRLSVPYRALPGNVDSYDKMLIALMAQNEGVRHRAYTCSGGYRTIGVGFNMDYHKERFKKLLGVNEARYRAVLAGETPLSDIQISTLFKDSMKEAESFVKNVFRGVPLADGQRAALVAMAFNSPQAFLGPKTELRRVIKAGGYNPGHPNYQRAVEIILLECNGGGSRSVGGQRRQIRTAELFTGCSTFKEVCLEAGLSPLDSRFIPDNSKAQFCVLRSLNFTIQAHKQHAQAR